MVRPKRPSHGGHALRGSLSLAWNCYTRTPTPRPLRSSSWGLRVLRPIRAARSSSDCPDTHDPWRGARVACKLGNSPPAVARRSIRRTRPMHHDRRGRSPSPGKELSDSRRRPGRSRSSSRRAPYPRRPGIPKPGQAVNSAAGCRALAAPASCRDAHADPWHPKASSCQFPAGHRALGQTPAICPMPTTQQGSSKPQAWSIPAGS